MSKLQSLNFDNKILLSVNRIKRWYQHWQGEVFISFSGGKYSTVLLHMVRSIYPGIPAVFVDTGIEYPEVVEYVKTVPDVVWLKPEKSFKEIVEEYGYPVVSGRVSRNVKRIREGKPGNLPVAWNYLLNAPFKISDQCCYFLKSGVLRKYQRETGWGELAGRRIGERGDRLRRDCAGWMSKQTVLNPLAFWGSEDIWNYLKTKEIRYPRTYEEGETRSVCMFCLYGRAGSRFERLRVTHPEIWSRAMTNLNLATVLNYTHGQQMVLIKGMED
ncbi:MAG: phosphoadenosine phosphosulfate reductase family protein [Nitrospinota bacterium]|nr:phosphoadenosine phosphosulfate reductase family protein [Nitrospinota bacterium]